MVKESFHVMFIASKGQEQSQLSPAVDPFHSILTNIQRPTTAGRPHHSLLRLRARLLVRLEVKEMYIRNNVINQHLLLSPSPEALVPKQFKHSNVQPSENKNQCK